MINLTWFVYYQKNSTSIPKNITNMESAERITRIEANKIVESVLDNNRTFDCQVALLRRIMYDDIIKERMRVVNGEMEDNYFFIN